MGERIRHAPTLLADTALALGIGACQIASTWLLQAPNDAAADAPMLAVALAVASTLPLIARRVAPVVVFSIICAVSALAAILGQSVDVLAATVALYTVATSVARAASLLALAALLVLGTAILATSGSTAGGAERDSVLMFGALSVAMIGVWGLGASTRSHREYTQGLQLRTARLEHEHEHEARIAVVEERARIARELHDIVANSVSVMLVGTRGARDVLRSSPTDAERTLERVEATGEQSLGDLRRALALLRDPAREVERGLRPRLAGIHDLVGEFRQAGLPVVLTISGQETVLPASTDLSVFRILQEALTNVLRHAVSPRSVEVSLNYAADRIEFEIFDNGRSREAPSNGDRPGHGLIGMRERAALLGGTIDARPLPGGGFLVSVSLPIREVELLR